MNIAINAMPSSGYGGITYLKHILPVLDRRQEEHSWFVYGRTRTLDTIRFPSQKVHFREVQPAGGIAGRLASEQFQLPRLFRRDQIDIVYTANNTDLFFAPRPRVNAIRYTEPFLYRLYPNSFSKRLRCETLRILTCLSVRSADHVICVSDYARKVVAESLAPTSRKYTVIHHGLEPEFAARAERPPWAPDQFVFAAAKMVGYANIHTLVEAYHLCRAAGLDVPLVVAGGPHDAEYERTVKSRIASLGLAEQVIFPGYVGQEQMAWLYGNAQVFVFCSLLEACPNTLIEALGCGAAIVSSDIEPSREVAGSAVVWCDGNDPAAMAAGMLRVIRDEDHALRLRAAARRQAERFSWERTAEALVGTLEAVYHGHGERGRNGGAD